MTTVDQIGEEADASLLTQLALRHDGADAWLASRLRAMAARAEERALLAGGNATDDGREFHIQIVHKEARFGTEEHYGDLCKVLRFLNGHYANVQPGDQVIVHVPDRTPAGCDAPNGEKA